MLNPISHLFNRPAMRHSTCVLLIAFLLVASCSSSSLKAVPEKPDSGGLQDVSSNPEPATLSSDASFVDGPIKQKTGAHYVAVTANPHASQAAGRVLQRGGSAIDAAIAAQMVLGLVEPQSSGIGGGGFLLYWDNIEGKLYSYDGRETAPAKATGKLFFDEQGAPLGFGRAIVGGRSVGVPGLLKMLDVAHREHGVLEWEGLFGDAIALADRGFAISPRLNLLVQRVPLLDKRAALREYLFEEDEPLAVGSSLKNKEYASTLRNISEKGIGDFYSGKIAQSIVDTVVNDPNAGLISLQDMQGYRAVERKPVCKLVLGYNICGMGMPSSGAVTVLGILSNLEFMLADGRLSRGASVSDDVDAAHAFIEASRLAFADRNTWLADADYVDVPVSGLLDPVYIEGRAGLINPESRMELVAAGEPENQGLSFVSAQSFEVPSTTHLSIVDGKGNIVSMTTSIESAFGSRLMTNGFILNNQLTDFSFLPNDKNGKQIANRVEGGKRPLSSMSPMIIFNKANKPVMVVGSPGGKSIIPYVARVIYDHIVGGKNLYEAVSAKHVVDTGRLRLEDGIDELLVQGLRAKGHEPELRGQSSGIHALHISPNGWVGVADPRREGSVFAE